MITRSKCKSFCGSILLISLLRMDTSVGFLFRVRSIRPTKILLLAKKTTKNKKSNKNSGGVVATTSGLKGFGSTTVISKKKNDNNVEIDTSKDTRNFYENFLQPMNAGDNLKRTALAYFDVGFKLRGVVCTRTIPKGNDIINIPYNAAFNLGPEGEDPTIPAIEFLRLYCTAMLNNNNNDDNNIHYFRMLPPYRGIDCLGSTDFFSDIALDALQSPLIVEETLSRRKKIQNRFDSDISNNSNFPSWIDGTSITVDHLQWAVWLITSRVLTVQSDDGKSYRLLIPYLDMCNHDRTSTHILTGKVGGSLRIKAGTNVQIGDQINICYGGGVAGNDRFIQDYGFIDNVGYDIVAQEIVGKRRIHEGIGRTLSRKDQERCIKTLQSTAIKHDEELLENNNFDDDQAVRTAIQYRLGVKKALAKFVVMP